MASDLTATVSPTSSTMNVTVTSIDNGADTLYFNLSVETNPTTVNTYVCTMPYKISLAPQKYSIDYSAFLTNSGSSMYRPSPGDIITLGIEEYKAGTHINGIWLPSFPYPVIGKGLVSSKSPLSNTIKPWWIILAIVLVLFLVFHKEFSGALASVSKSIGVSKILKNLRR
jgi:hypothetical protein